MNFLPKQYKKASIWNLLHNIQVETCINLIYLNINLVPGTNIHLTDHIELHAETTMYNIHFHLWQEALIFVSICCFVNFFCHWVDLIAKKTKTWDFQATFCTCRENLLFSFFEKFIVNYLMNKRNMTVCLNKSWILLGYVLAAIMRLAMDVTWTASMHFGIQNVSVVVLATSQFQTMR